MHLYHASVLYSRVTVTARTKLLHHVLLFTLTKKGVVGEAPLVCGFVIMVFGCICKSMCVCSCAIPISAVHSSTGWEEKKTKKTSKVRRRTRWMTSNEWRKLKNGRKTDNIGTIILHQDERQEMKLKNLMQHLHPCKPFNHVQNIQYQVNWMLH